MTPQEIIDALTDYGFADMSATRKMEKINATIWDIVEREPWPFMEGTIDLTFDGTNATPSNSPSDLLSVLDIVRIDTGEKLQPYRLQEADAKMSQMLTQSGEPVRWYYFIAGTLYVAQIPTSTMTMRMRYIKKHPKVAQTDPESAILIPKEHHEVVLYGALSKLNDLEDDTDLSVRFQQLYENKYQNMRSSIWMRQYDRPDHIQVVDGDGYGYWDTYEYS